MTKEYIALGQRILDEGRLVPDRTNTGRIRLFGTDLRFDLKEGFPLLTTKKVFTKGIVEELLWFLQGNTNNNDLKAAGVHIWDQWELKPTNIESFLVKLIAQHDTMGAGKMTEEHIAELRAHMTENLGSIGPLYGQAWRYAPAADTDNPLQSARVVYDRMLSDHQEYVRDVLAQNAKTIDTATEAELQNVVGMVTSRGIDQIAYVLDLLKRDPYSARIIVSAWIPQWLPHAGESPEHNILLGRGALAPCHCLFQFFAEPLTDVERVKWAREHKPEESKAAEAQLMAEIQEGKFRDPDESNKEAISDYTADALVTRNYELYHAIPGVPKDRLSCRLYQRSADYCVGVPFNIASYALLTHMVAQVVGMDAGDFIWSGGDTHHYANHPETFAVQAAREPRALPRLWLNPEVTDILKFTSADIRFEGYEPHDKLVYEVAK